MSHYATSLWQIVGDGETTALIMPEEKKVLILDRPYVDSIEINYPTMTAFDGGFDCEQLVCGPGHCSVSLQGIPKEWTDDLPDFRSLQKMSIRELLKVIQRKLRERG